LSLTLRALKFGLLLVASARAATPLDPKMFSHTSKKHHVRKPRRMRALNVVDELIVLAIAVAPSSLISFPYRSLFQLMMP
jgi:hypothetical protein